MTGDRDERLLTLIHSARQRASDRLIIKTMRVAVWGLGAIAVLFVAYIFATFYVGMHDNHRIDDLEQRVHNLEQKAPAR